MEHPSGLRLEVRLARSRVDIEACQQLVAETYLRDYGVVLTAGDVDPDGGVERFPDRFAMGTVGGDLVACAGLYVHDTYVEKFGGVVPDDIAQAMRAAGVEDDGLRPRVEYTKVVVDRRWGRKGIGRRFIGATHSRDFLSFDGMIPLVLVCAKLSVFRLWEAVGIRTRHLKMFPLYRNHAKYRTPDDAMESRLVIPELDIDRKWYDHSLSELDIEVSGGIHAY